MTWYDGGLMPPTPAEMPAGQQLPDNGVLYVGSKGKMYHSSHGGMPEVFAAVAARSKPSGAQDDEPLARPLRGMGAACKGGPRPVSNFDYSGPMTETVLLGVLSLRAPGTRLEWDSANLKVTNAPELERVHPHRVSQGLDAVTCNLRCRSATALSTQVHFAMILPSMLSR